MRNQQHHASVPFQNSSQLVCWQNQYNRNPCWFQLIRGAFTASCGSEGTESACLPNRTAVPVGRKRWRSTSRNIELTEPRQRCRNETRRSRNSYGALLGLFWGPFGPLGPLFFLSFLRCFTSFLRFSSVFSKCYEMLIFFYVWGSIP